MPVFVEASNILDLGGLAGGHMYSAYVPEGSKADYDAYRSIGVFPDVGSFTGPWGLSPFASHHSGDERYQNLA